MCYSLDLMHDITTLLPSIHVSLPNGATLLVNKIGSVTITDTLILQNVLFVPSFYYNLFSVPKWALDTGHLVTFFPQHCFFKHHTNDSILAIGRVEAGLYHLQINSPQPSLHTCSNFEKVAINSVLSKRQSSALWHLRLGHVSTPVLHKIPAITNSISDSHTKTCHICPLAKQSHLPFHVSTSHVTHIFDLIHVDLWGPYFHETSHGCRFFLTIVDDHSRAIWTFLLATKQHVFTQLTHFCAYVENQFHTTVKAFRSDHGT